MTPGRPRRGREAREEHGERIATDPEALTVAPSVPLRLLDLPRRRAPGPVRRERAQRGDARAPSISPRRSTSTSRSAREEAESHPEIKRFQLNASGRLDVHTKLSGSGTMRRPARLTSST